jgi:hypothetical protein
MRAVLIILLSILVGGCWTAKKCAKADRYCPVDTIVRVDSVVDSFYIEKVITDTLINYDSITMRDTVVIENTRVKVKLYKVPGNKLGVSAEAKDTTIKYVKEITTITKTRVMSRPQWVYFLMVFCGYVLGWYISKLYYDRK